MNSILTKKSQHGFTNQQALLILIIVFPLGIMGIGLILTVHQRQQMQVVKEAKPPVHKLAAPEPQTLDNLQVDASDAAINTVNKWIKAMSDGDELSIKSYMTGSAEIFYDPIFLSQFHRISISDLQVTSRSGSFVNLNGVITFVYKDGTTQRETRSFTVQLINSAFPFVTATEFIAVTKERS